MKIALTILTFLVAVNVVSAQVLITEVYYDPVATETGGEAVEIYNAGNYTADIGGLTIKTKSSAADLTIPTGTTLQARKYFLLADSGWNQSKDNPLWPEANYEEAMTLTNSDAGLALMNGSVILDAVGWGSSSSELFMGTPHTGASSGSSLQRVFTDNFQNTNNNLADFFAASPDFKNYVAQSAGNSGTFIDIIINISASDEINSFSVIEDDLSDEGTQIAPFPGQDRIIQSEIFAKGNGQMTVFFDGQTFYGVNVSSQNGMTKYIVNISLPYYRPAGNYAMIANFGEVTLSKNITVLGLVAINLNETKFESNGKGSTSIKVKNIGNSQLDLELKPSHFQSKNFSINSSSLSYKIQDFQGIFSSTPEMIDLDLEPTSFGTLELFLNVAGAPAGVYSGKLEVVGLG